MKNSKIQNKPQSFDFQNNNNDWSENFKLRLKKSKNIHINSVNYIPSAVDRIKGGISLTSKNDVPVKIKEKKYTVNIQNSIMDMNIIKNYHKVFVNEERHIYSNEYIKNFSNLLYKNEKNYITKRNQLYSHKQHNKNNSENTFYITNFVGENATKQKIFEDKIESPNDEDKYSLNETYGSNESVDLTKSQNERMKKNLRKEYKFCNHSQFNKNETIRHDMQIEFDKPYKINRLPFIIRNSINKMTKNIDENNYINQNTNDDYKNFNTVHSTSALLIRNNRSHSPIKQILSNLKCLKELKIKISNDQNNNTNNTNRNNHSKKF